MGRFLRLHSGVPRGFEEGNSIPIYSKSLSIVESDPGPDELVGPIITGTDITLPDGQEYHSKELQIFINGNRLESVFDYMYVGSVPRTKIQFTFDLEILDRIDFIIERSY